MLSVLAFALLASATAASLAYVVLQPRIATEKKNSARISQFARAETDGAAKHAARDRVAETVKRRKTLQNSLKDIDLRQKERSRHANKPNLRRQIEQAGLTISDGRFIGLSVACGAVGLVLFYLFTGSPLVALGAAAACGLGLPRFGIGYWRRRRMKKFSDEFADALDLIVRGVKSGLPVNDTFRMISTEAAEPVRSEFRKVVEAQQLGVPIGEAVERLYQNMPLSETNFFSIVIAIQSTAGGNLSEALGNLSRVLRERKKMKAKVQAMSMEAKASAGIIGSLPGAVAGLIYLTTPDYISVLFTHPTGHMIIGGSLVWMSIGVLVMRQMINFDF